MENSEKPDEDIMMDFESGIDTWIIDKEDTVSSIVSLDKEKAEVKVESNMNKENIKRSAPESGSKSLRNFRIRKRVSYQEISSESESESIKKVEVGFCNKRRSDSSIFSKAFKSVDVTNEKNKEKESLSSEEISSMLSEFDGTQDGSPGSNREKLLSIENVTTAVDSKNSPPSLPEIKHPEVEFCLGCKKRECCNCVSSKKAKLICRSHKSSYQNFPKSNHPMDNVITTTHNKSRDRSISEVEFKINCQRCFDSPEYCKCDLIDYERKGQKNNISHLLTRNYISDHGIAPVNEGGLLSKKPTTLTTNTAKPKIGDDASLICGICGYLSAELLIYKSHQILFHSEKTDLECEYCEFKTNQRATLATHIRVHFQMDCPLCDYHCSLKSSLGTHLLRYHQNAPTYKCKKCNYSCNSQSVFYDHLQMHAVQQYQCNECKKCFSNKRNLKTHTRKHLKTQYFKCSKCELRFPHRQSLKLHMKCHEKMSDSFVCNICNASFTKKNELISHSKTHITVTKTFKCEKCQLSFSQVNHLKLHMRSHNNKHTKCKNCTFQCSDSSDIKDHLCVNKLYDVQTRTLNFERVEKDFKTASKVETIAKNTPRETPIPEKKIVAKNLPTPSESKLKSDDLKKSKKTRPKVLAVRQNLRSFKTEEKSVTFKDKLQNKRKNTNERRGRPKKKVDESKTQTQIKNKRTCSTGMLHINMKDGRSLKKQRKVIRRIRNDRISKGLDVINQLFGKKKLLKEFLVKPVAFSNSNFIECYYQSQQPTSVSIPLQHEERHLRRPSLLSCRYCSYKTNSQQLLKCHVTKNHTWDPAVVSKLFKP